MQTHAKFFCEKCWQDCRKAHGSWCYKSCKYEWTSLREATDHLKGFDDHDIVSLVEFEINL